MTKKSPYYTQRTRPILEKLTAADLDLAWEYNNETTEMIVEMLTRKKTYAEIGKKYGLTRQATFSRVKKFLAVVAGIKQQVKKRKEVKQND